MIYNHRAQGSAKYMTGVIAISIQHQFHNNPE